MMTGRDTSRPEQLAGQIVMIHRGQIAFDGDFGHPRQTFGDRRRPLIYEARPREVGDSAQADFVLVARSFDRKAKGQVSARP